MNPLTKRVNMMSTKQMTVHTMLKDPEISKYAARRTHRTYTAQFKAELVAACQDLNISVVAVAGQHGMNANVLHRWLKEHRRGGTPPAAAFIPVQLPTPTAAPKGIHAAILDSSFVNHVKLLSKKILLLGSLIFRGDYR